MPSFRLFIFFFLMYFPYTEISAQEDRIRSIDALAEKIYLHFDNKIYINDQEVWFKAVVTSAASNALSNLSKILYVDLISPDEKIVEKKMLKLNNGIGHNFFQLSSEIQPGTYQIRAYTEWNKNFPHFNFKAYINVFSSEKEIKRDPIGAVNLVEENPDEFWLETQMVPELLDSLQKKWINVYLTLGENKDSVSIKERNGTYSLEYPVPSGINITAITMETSSGKKFTKTIAVNSEKVDLQFFPEGGELVEGTMNRIGFKALDFAGRGLAVEGEVLNSENEVVQTFKSNSLGMGNFFLFLKKEEAYKARLTSPFRKDNFMLPEVSSEGSSLTVIRGKDDVRIITTSNNSKSDSVFVEVSARGLAYYMLQGKLNEGKFYTSIPSQTLPHGLVVFTLLGGDRQPIAERLYFNEKPEEQLSINLNTENLVYSTREKTNLNIKVYDQKGNAVKTNLSVLVINKERLANEQVKRGNILSYFWLESELRGTIEDPFKYFDKENNTRFEDLENLLLTQGWRKYNYTTPTHHSLAFNPENNLQVSGTVGGAFSAKRRKEDVQLTMITFGESKAIYTQTTDSLGRFNFNLSDEFGGNMDILLQTKNNSGKKKNFTVTLNEKRPYKIEYDHRNVILAPDSIIYKIVEEEQERKLKDDSYEMLSDITQLDEVLLTGPKMTPQRQKVTDRYGKPEIVISGEAIQEEEESWSYGLYSVLKFSFPKQIRIYEVDGILYAKVLNQEPTIIVIDGVPVMEYNYSLIPNIPPSEVQSVEIIEYASNFYRLYQEVYPRAGAKAPTQGNVIAIYTDAGKGLFHVEKPKGLLEASIPVFSANKEFYQPKYEEIAILNSDKPDLRSVIMWEPEIITDATGNASISFYNSDVTGDNLIIVEAIAEDGKIGYQTFNYQVIENVNPD